MAFTKSVMAGAVRTLAQQAAAPKAAPAAGGGAGLDLLPWPKVDFAKFGPVGARICRASRRSRAPTCTATG